YSQGASGSLDVDLASAVSYDVLNISGSATLAGTLNVNYLGGYTGASSTHTIITSSPLSGTFATINDVNILTPIYSATSFGLGSPFNTWINAAGGDWSLGSNWSYGHEPTAAEDARVPDLSGAQTNSILSASHTPKSFSFLGDEIFS